MQLGSNNKDTYQTTVKFREQLDLCLGKVKGFHDADDTIVNSSHDSQCITYAHVVAFFFQER